MESEDVRLPMRILCSVALQWNFLKGHSHAILVHFKNQKYVLTSMNAHKQWSSFVAKDYITSMKLFSRSSVATDGTDGSGLQLENIRLNFDKLLKFFQRVDIKSILSGHGLFSLNEIIKLICSFKCSITMLGMDKVSYR